MLQNISMEFDTELFGERLKKLRIKKGITTVRLGQEIGVSDATVSRWENGLIRPTADSIVKLVKFFKIPAGYLMGTEDYHNLV